MSRAAIVFSLALAAACGDGAPAPQQDNASAFGPDDFARGVEVTAPPGPFFRIDLPEAAFSGTAWPDLRDVRVFNREGEAVPFARVTPRRAGGETKLVPLRSFRIEGTAAQGAPRIALGTSGRALEVRVVPGKDEHSSVEYVLASAIPDLDTPIHRLLLEWKERDTNWRQTVTVSVSSDLESWSTVAANRPLMDLRTADGSRLKHREITVDPTTPSSARYWRLQFGAGDAPALTSVEGETRSAAEDLPGVVLPMASAKDDNGAAVYELSAAQPLARLRITPQDANSVLPVIVESREQVSASWTAIGRGVVYRLTTAGAEQVSDPLRLNGRLVKSIRIRPLGTSWGSGMPRLDVERDPLTLVVNGRGGGPFLLAWGSRAASDIAVPFAQLVPHLTSDRLLEIPPGQTRGGYRVLGGDAKLTAMAPAERAARWQTTLVWLVLIGGAAALALLALRVWREARMSQDEA
jgi:hypothetical protein